MRVCVLARDSQSGRCSCWSRSVSPLRATLSFATCPAYSTPHRLPSHDAVAHRRKPCRTTPANRHGGAELENDDDDQGEGANTHTRGTLPSVWRLQTAYHEEPHPGFSDANGRMISVPRPLPTSTHHGR